MRIEPNGVRQRLPDRRPGLTRSFDWRGETIHLTVGVDAHGYVRELFLTGPKSGSDMLTLIQDGAIAISIALQCGASLALLAAAMGFEEDFEGHRRATSILGQALAEAKEIERGERGG